MPSFRLHFFFLYFRDLSVLSIFIFLLHWLQLFPLSGSNLRVDPDSVSFLSRLFELAPQKHIPSRRRISDFDPSKKKGERRGRPPSLWGADLPAARRRDDRRAAPGVRDLIAGARDEVPPFLG